MSTIDPARAAIIRALLLDHVVASTRPSKWSSRVGAAALVASGIILGAGGTAAIAVGIASDEAEVASSARTMGVFRELSELSGFVSGGPAVTGSDDLVVYWSGPLGAASDIADSAASEGISVRFEEVLRSPDDLWSDATALAGALGARGIEVTGFGPNRAYDTIELMGPELSVDPILQSVARDLAAELIGTDLSIGFLPNEMGVVFPAETPVDD
jgi:hypothetical protein